jgi:hypothetical protein
MALPDPDSPYFIGVSVLVGPGPSQLATVGTCSSVTNR